MRQIQSERGSALIGVMLVVVMLSMLATVSLNLAAQEVESVAAAREDAAARHLAEAGSDLVVQWLHDPSSVPPGPAAGLLAPRQVNSSGVPSFFDAQGRSQYAGTAERPDLVYDAVRPEDRRILSDLTGGGPVAGQLGRIERLTLYRPTTPGLLCTVEVTARSGRLARTMSAQLGAREFPPLRAGVQIGTLTPVQAASKPLPVWVHWGDLIVNGDVQLEAAKDLPAHAALASVNGQSYAEMDVREDRWFNFFVGGAVIGAPGAAGPPPAQVHAHQEPAPGLRLDRWDYQTMKDAAFRDGTYYARGSDGLLYRDGRIEPGLGVTVDVAFRSSEVGDTRGLVFVDTLDQAPPRADNLGTLAIPVDYAEGVFVVNAHVRFAPDGSGRPVPALSPPIDAQGGTGTRVPVELSGIHLRGALAVSGDLSFEGQPRLFGAVHVGGHLTQASDSAGRLEVWYDEDLRAGIFQGLPRVFQASASWMER